MNLIEAYNRRRLRKIQRKIANINEELEDINLVYDRATGKVFGARNFSLNEKLLSLLCSIEKDLLIKYPEYKNAN